MFYPSYDDYMRDVFYFNGLQNPNNMYYMNGVNSNNTNLNNLYPSIYKIVNPVIQKVVNGNNSQFINEEIVDNITDVVVGITAGDISNMEKEVNTDVRKQNNSNNQQPSSNANNTCNNDGLLRDLIKILVIKELISRNNVRRFPYTYSGMPYCMNNPAIPYMIN